MVDDTLRASATHRDAGDEPSLLLSRIEHYLRPMDVVTCIHDRLFITLMPEIPASTAAEVARCLTDQVMADGHHQWTFTLRTAVAETSNVADADGLRHLPGVIAQELCYRG